jgi:hypothetical protein
MARNSIDRDRTRRDRQHLAETPARGSAESVHYGKKFAETEAHLRARNHEPGTPPGIPELQSDDHLGSTDAQVSPTPAQASSGAAASETGQGPHSRPADRLRSDPPPVGGLAMAVAFGADALDAFRRLGQASRTVALLPLRAARLVWRLGTTWIRGSPGRA